MPELPPRRKRLIPYCRVSTTDQFDRGAGLPVQDKAIREYAERLNYEVIDGDWWEDISGAVPIEQRPVGGKALEMLQRGEADAIAVHVFDRLVRPPDEGDEWDVAPLIRGLARVGKEIHTTKDGLLRNDFTGLLVAVFYAHAAGQERRDIARRTSSGRRHWAESGRYVANGQPPYGYARSKPDGARFSVLVKLDMDGEPPPDAGAADWSWWSQCRVVIWIFMEYTRDVGGATLRSLCAQLNAHRVPPPGREVDGRRKCATVPTGWHQGAVSDILRNPAYAGLFRSEHCLVAVPGLAIVEQVVWDAAQERLTANARDSRRNAQHTYLLGGGRLKCLCGYTMVGQVGGGRLAYRCSAYGGRPRSAEWEAEHPRHPNTLDAAMIDALVWRWLVDTLSDPERLALAQAGQADLRRQDAAPLELELAACEAGIEQQTRAVRRLMAAYGAGDDDAQRAVDDAKAVRVDMERERDRIRAQLDALARADADAQAGRELAEQVRAKLAEADAAGDMEWKQRQVRRFQLAVQFCAEAGTDARTGAGRRWLEITSPLVGAGTVEVPSGPQLKRAEHAAKRAARKG